MTDKKFKVLVLNPSPTRLEKAVNIVNLQNKKAGPFEFSIFLGDVLPNSQIDQSNINPDIPIYFSQGEKDTIDKPSGLNDKFNYLGKIGIYKLTNGLKIGYISGNIKDLSVNEIKDKFSGQNLDILITYFWPASIAMEEKLLLSGDNKLDCLINLVKPQYWFSCGSEKGRFFERKLFKIDNRIIRFISLATMNEGRWWYAFQVGLNPTISEDLKLSDPPTLEDEVTAKRINNELNKSNDGNVTKKQNTNGKSGVEITPDTCFLCLSNPKFELHMIISIGKLCFLTICKGPLTLQKDFGFSGHGMIVPIEHYPTLRSYVINKDSNKKVENSNLVKEINKVQISLVDMFRKLGDFSLVFWEISRRRSIHGHIQFVPVPDKTVSNFETVLRNQIDYDTRLYPEPLKFLKFQEHDDMTELNETINAEDYVLFTLYESSKVTKYLIKLGNDDDKYFDAQFPRKVLAVLLNLKNRIHWSKCKETHEQESIQKAEFQKAYQDFDIMRN